MIVQISHTASVAVHQKPSDWSGAIDSFLIMWWPWKPVQLDGHLDWLHFDTSGSELIMSMHNAWACIIVLRCRGIKMQSIKVAIQLHIQLHWFPWSPFYEKGVYTLWQWSVFSLFILFTDCLHWYQYSDSRFSIHACFIDSCYCQWCSDNFFSAFGHEYMLLVCCPSVQLSLRETFWPSVVMSSLQWTAQNDHWNSMCMAWALLSCSIQCYTGIFFCLRPNS